MIYPSLTRLKSVACKTPALTTPSFAAQVGARRLRYFGFHSRPSFCASHSLLPRQNGLHLPISKNRSSGFIYQETTQRLTAYEIKRGFGKQDAEALHAIDERLTALHRVLPIYATSKRMSPIVIDVAVVGYYGQLGARVGRHRVIASHDFPSEFGLGTAAFVDAVNDYYRHCLLREAASHFVSALQQMAEIETFRDAIAPAASLGTELLPRLETAHHPWDDL